MHIHAKRLELECLILAAAEKWEKGAVYEGKNVGGQWKPKNKNAAASREPEEKSMPESIEYAKSSDQIDEVLCKRVVYFLDKGGDPKQVEKFLKSRNIELVKKLDNPETGLSSFLLRQGKNSMYVFVGSNDSKDWKDDLDGEVGRTQFDADRENIKNILLEEKQAGQKVKVFGHSLGGALSQITGSEFPELIDEIKTFNSPGVYNTTSAKFKQVGSGIKVTHFVNQGDVVSSYGQKLISGDAKLYGNALPTHRGFEESHKVFLTSPEYSRELPTPKWLAKRAA